ncbi:MAG TPA: hypothetical protein VLH56_19300 [Dissulfurispiraceae bacterium]|nr:hypothetical protein [Dissulfurispiraceae bacterium]
METLIIDIPCKVGDEFNITPYTDLHDDAASCAHNILHEHMQRRAALPNARFLSLGDMANLVLPGPDKRSTPSAMVDLLDEAIEQIQSSKLSDAEKLIAITSIRKEYRERESDALIDLLVDRQIERYQQYPWLFLGTGNHCTAALKHHFTHVTKRVCDRLNIPYGGYSGIARLRFNIPNRDGHAKLTILYHHGAWSGQVIKGLGGAKRWAAGFDEWDVCLYGHNHQLHLHEEPKVRMSARGVLEHRDVYIANCGTFLKGYRQGGSADYGEQRGYPAVSLNAPLMTIRITSDGYKFQISLGDV